MAAARKEPSAYSLIIHQNISDFLVLFLQNSSFYSALNVTLGRIIVN